MAKNTSILLDTNFITKQTRKYTSTSEVVRAALRIFEHEESKKELVKSLDL